jgi:hypothetical protein
VVRSTRCMRATPYHPRHGDESRRYGPPFRHGKRLLPLGDRKTSELDRRQVRRHFEKRFTTMRMAQKYLRQYNALVQRNAGEAPASGPPRRKVQCHP